MNYPKPNIMVNVDVTNPGQFFACCGLLELADRLWPGAEGWFDQAGMEFNIACEGTLSKLLSSIMACEMEPLMSSQELDELQRLTKPYCDLETKIQSFLKQKRKKQAELKELKDRQKTLKKEQKVTLEAAIEELAEQKKALEAELKTLKTELTIRKSSNSRLSQPQEKRKTFLNSKRIASGFKVLISSHVNESPSPIRIDWWLVENCDGDHLKTWAGQQTIASIAKAIHQSLSLVSADQLFDYETLIMRDGEAVAPLSFDSGRVGTAQDIGYSSDKIGQPISCCVWTEFLTLIALQRFALKPDADDFFTYYVWYKPLPTSVAAVAARGLFPQLIGFAGRFQLTGRDSGNRYKAFQQAALTEWRL